MKDACNWHERTERISTQEEVRVACEVAPEGEAGCSGDFAAPRFTWIPPEILAELSEEECMFLVELSGPEATFPH